MRPNTRQHPTTGRRPNTGRPQNNTRRMLRAYVRDTRVLIRQFRVTLIIFATLITIGTLIVRFAYEPEQPLGWAASFDTVFKLMFFETSRDYPHHLPAQLVFTIWPFLGLALVVNGVVNFGTALFNRQQRREAWQVAIASTYRDHIIVCGLGKLGYRVVQQLLAIKYEVVGIEQDPQSILLERLHKAQVPVLIGDARSSDLLASAGIKAASAVVVCTENDLTNLDIALEVREMNPDAKIVLRMFDQELAERVCRGFGIHTAFSASALAAPALAAAATRAAVEYSFYVDDVLFNLSRTTVNANSQLIGMTVEEAQQTMDLSIILHRNATRMDYNPAGSAELAEGDQIVVFATLEALACLDQMNGGEEACPPPKRGLFGRLQRKKRGS